MSVYGFKFTRPDKRAPFINWFARYSDMDRTIQSILHLTAKDYGCTVQFYAPAVGHKENLRRLIMHTGEDGERLNVELGVFYTAPESAIVHMRPRRVRVWERATPEAIVHWAMAKRDPQMDPEPPRPAPPKLPNMQKMTGVERFYVRRRSITRGKMA